MKTKFTQVLADQICERLVEGESLRAICLGDDMPSASTICRWLGDNKAFREQYARAREAQADTLADEILDIADDATNDWMERKNADDQPIGWQLNGEHVQRSRLRIDSRKWFASKLAPKKYGDKLDIDAKTNGKLTMEVGPSVDAITKLSKAQRAQLRNIARSLAGKS